MYGNKSESQCNDEMSSRVSDNSTNVIICNAASVRLFRPNRTEHIMSSAKYLNVSSALLWVLLTADALQLNAVEKLHCFTTRSFRSPNPEDDNVDIVFGASSCLKIVFFFSMHSQHLIEPNPHPRTVNRQINRWSGLYAYRQT